MVLRSDSSAGVRFLASVAEGRGIKPSARAAGVGKETRYRWLRDTFIELRRQGSSVKEARIELGISLSRAEEWDKHRVARGGDGRHHLAVPARMEKGFWVAYLGGGSLEVARRSAGVGRSTGYRWLQARFLAARRDGQSVKSSAPMAAARAQRWRRGGRPTGSAPTRWPVATKRPPSVSRCVARPAMSRPCLRRAGSR